MRKPPDPLRMSWPPVLQGTADREMMGAALPAASSGLSGASSMGLASSSVLWFPSDSLEQRTKMGQIKREMCVALEGWAPAFNTN